MKKYIVLFSLLFAFPCFASDVASISGVADSGIASIMGVTGSGISTLAGINYDDGDAGFACSSSGNILEESFDTNPGYDNTWSETVSGTGSVVNEDLSAPAVTGFNGEAIRTYASAAWANAYTRQTDSGDQATNYLRLYMYVQATNINDACEQIFHWTTTAGMSIVKISLCETGESSYYLSLDWGQYGAAEDDTYNISLQTSYRLEFYWKNDTPDEGEWKVDGVSQGTVNGTWSAGTGRVHLGLALGGTARTVDVYWDNVGVNTTGWLGACE